MVKFFVILALLLLLVGFIYWLLHPYIKMARKALGFIQGVRTGTRGANPTARERQPVAAQKLTKCVHCGTWVPAAKAVQTRGGEYCSIKCRNAA